VGNVATIASFDELLTAYQREIYRYALHLTRNPSDADDLYQETFLKAYRAYDRLDGDANFRAWLYRIATNTFLSQRRKASRERPLNDDADGLLPAATDDQPATLDARDLLVEVHQFIQGLPEKQRVALVLRKYHEFDYRQIGEALQCSEDAARANVYEALKKLRASFGDRL
jgi:RNA polymerase sigma-70 factor, ECF subfamily